MSKPAKKIDQLPEAIALIGGNHYPLENTVLKMELCRERMAGLNQELGSLSQQLLVEQAAAIEKQAAIGEYAQPAIGKAQLYVYDPSRKALVLRVRPTSVEG